MSEPALSVRKLGYSIHPWRILLDGHELRIVGSVSMSFALKRDAIDAMRKLHEIGDWSRTAEFTDAQKKRACEIANDTDAMRIHVKALDRPRPKF